MLFRLDSRLFWPCRALGTLNLARNDELTRFKLNVHDLPYLYDFEMFKCEVLADYMFRGFVFQIFRLGSCSIRRIDRLAFNQMFNIRQLYLDNNFIKSLNLSVMNMHRLTTLDISNNKIEIIDPAEFLNLNSLEELIIGGNPIKTFSSLANLNKLFGSLELLNMSNVSSELIDSLNFTLLKNVQTLDLSKNKIRSGKLVLMKSLMNLLMRDSFGNGGNESLKVQFR